MGSHWGSVRKPQQQEGGHACVVFWCILKCRSCSPLPCYDNVDSDSKILQSSRLVRLASALGMGGLGGGVKVCLTVKNKYYALIINN